MNMKNLLIGSAVSAAVMTMSAPAFAAPAAKFAASWDTTPVTATSTDACISAVCTANQDSVNVDVLLSTMKVPEGKEIFVGVSAETLIHLVTVAKGGKLQNSATGYTSTAKAQGSVDVTLSLENAEGESCTVLAPSDSVTLKAEMRELTVAGGSNIEDTDFWVEVGITTDSKSANHFEFIGVDCPQGTYDLIATFDLLALTEASGYDSSATATVTLYDRMITMQGVRAVKGSILDPDSTEPAL